MKIYEGTKTFEIEGKSAVAIGKFDGFHVGHQALVREVMKKKEIGLQVVIFTFFPSPAKLFSKKPIKELTTRDEKRQLFRQAGVDVLIEYPFDMETAQMLPEDFIRDILVKQIHAKSIIAGDDVSFGRFGSGNSVLLEKMAVNCGYDVNIIEKVKLHGQEISSTYVRDAIKQGDMVMATALLGAPYYIAGVVSNGKQLGRTLGIPTANLYPEEEKLLPPFGVYYAKVTLDGECFSGIANIGMKPTVTDEKKISVETYIYDFEGDIYGHEMGVSLLKFMRPEQKFENVEALKLQMQKDIAEGKRYYLDMELD